MQMEDSKIEKLRQGLKELGSNFLKEKEPLAPYTTFKIGGPAKLFFIASSIENLTQAIRIAYELNFPFFILGGGSNLLVSDEGFSGLAIKNECRKIIIDDCQITAQSGASLADLIELARKNSLTGLEFAVGIYGTVGGGICGNAGAYGSSLGQFLTKAVLLAPPGEIKNVGNDYFEFEYRGSKLKQNSEILLSATFQLKKGDEEEINEKINKIQKEREIRIPKEPSAGCYFKNIEAKQGKISVGFLLEQIGAKSLRINDAAVSKEHANILINQGNAKAKEIRKLADILKEKVFEKFHLHLKEEIVYLDKAALKGKEDIIR
jgi:UDP-N-acetylmuramate dehydrogenase